MQYNLFELPTGSTEHDVVRLNKQLGRVFDLMRDGKWYTIDEVNKYAGGTPSGTSAHIRSLRRAKMGSHTIEREYVGNGLHKYRLVPNKNIEVITEDL